MYDESGLLSRLSGQQRYEQSDVLGLILLRTPNIQRLDVPDFLSYPKRGALYQTGDLHIIRSRIATLPSFVYLRSLAINLFSASSANIGTIFRLPLLRTLSCQVRAGWVVDLDAYGFRYGDPDDGNIPWHKDSSSYPKRSSPITDLSFEVEESPTPYMAKLIACCRQLKRLRIASQGGVWLPDNTMYEVSYAELAHALRMHVNTLETIQVDIKLGTELWYVEDDDYGASTDLADLELDYVNDFQGFTELRTLCLPIETFQWIFPKYGDSGMFDALSERMQPYPVSVALRRLLPPNICQLHLTAHRKELWEVCSSALEQLAQTLPASFPQLSKVTLLVQDISDLVTVESTQRIKDIFQTLGVDISAKRIKRVSTIIMEDI
jgi:hypothetical protein